ncbi:MAG: EAL domain-containing protein [Janthinobacterium lividum]
MPFSMAFQPIVNVATGRVYAYEALIRGVHGESAYSVLSQVTEQNRYAFDQSCRVKAISVASQLRLQDTGALLSINFLPGAVYSPAACIQLTLKTAEECHFPAERMIFEFTEGEKVDNPNHLAAIAKEYHRHGFRVAIDDFGAGYANLNLLADLPINVLKMDMELIRNLHLRPKAYAMVRAFCKLCADFGIELVAEGVETVEEYQAVRDCGVYLIQGYLLAKPAFEQLPPFHLPPTSGLAAHPLLPAGLGGGAPFRIV